MGAGGAGAGLGGELGGEVEGETEEGVQEGVPGDVEAFAGVNGAEGRGEEVLGYGWLG